MTTVSPIELELEPSAYLDGWPHGPCRWPHGPCMVHGRVTQHEHEVVMGLESFRLW